MSTGLVKQNSVFGVEEETTEGTYRAPQATTSFIQVLDGESFKPSREVIDRGLITASPGKETPRMGMKSCTAQIPVELRASGVAGGETDFDSLLKCALGARRQNTALVTSRAGSNTSTNILIEDADIAKFNVGDMVAVFVAGAFEVRPILSKASGTGTASITLAFALTAGAPASGVTLGKFTTYYTAASGHPSLSYSRYLANEIRQAGIGMKVTQMTLDGWEPGKVASLKFALEGVNFTETNGAAPYTPAYDTGLPPIILNACVWRDGVLTPVPSLALQLQNELSFMTDTCSANGRTASRVKSREITGSFSPYKDDTSTDYFDDWVAGTEFSIFAYAYNPAATGEFGLGSVVGIWLPQCITTEFESSDVDGIVVDQMGFRATRGTAGDKEELYIGKI